MSATEALRQQRLLRALWREESDADLAGWLRESPAQRARGIAAYRVNGAANAARALAAAYPTVAALVGGEAFEGIAAVHWLRHPPRRGDLALFGEALPEALAADAQLAELPYVADVARLDWAVHCCEAAADDDAPVAGIGLLGEADPAALRLGMRAGLTVLASPWPVVTIRQAHGRADAERFAPVRAALARGDAEAAIVWRSGWRARVELLAVADARFTAALLAPHTLAGALDAAGAEFEFEPWLLRALRDGWLRAVESVT
jgi:hypothetical protein